MTKKVILIILALTLFSGLACERDNSTDNSIPEDTIAPVSGNSGTITTSSLSSTSLTLNWTAAADNSSAPGALQYLAYYSTGNNIDSVTNCESNGTAVGSYAADITTKNVTGLSNSTTYYFSVIVKDEEGNKAAYSTLTQATKSTIPADYIMRYRLDNNGNDDKGTLHLSSVTGSPVYETTSPNEGSHYFSVDGNDDIHSPGSYNITTTSISMAAWIYVDSSFSGTNPTAVDIDGIGFWYNSSGKLRGGIGGIFGQFSISTNTWYHAVFTWDNSNVKLFVNGELKETTPGSTDITTTEYPLYIGTKAGADFWHGYIDDVIIYNRALSASEASDIFNSY